MVLFGQPTEEVMTQLKTVVQKGDVVVDGANSFYKDTQTRSEEFEKQGIRFLGIGVSGGILAPDNGFPLMVGGNMSAYRYIETILDSLAKPNGGHEYFGTGGAGHFVKMVHNGIEYGMMQAIGEGFGVLQKGPYTMDLEKVASLWTKGTIVASFLMDRAKDALQKDPVLKKTGGYIEENGEAKWTIALAKKLQVPIQVIEDSLKFRIASQKIKKDLPAGRQVQNSFAAKMVAALRHEFGGHKVKEK
jgi:6-phosphogluconate dehydrogenase